MKRIRYFDAIKTLAIFLVCFFHSHTLDLNIIKNSTISTFFNYYIHSLLGVCVPLFFMVNGALLLNKDFDLVVCCKRALKLYFLLYFWAVVLLLALKYVYGDSYTFYTFLKSVWAFRLGRINHLWFLKALISINLIFPLIKLAYDMDNRKIFYFSITLIFIFSFGNRLINHILNIIFFFLDVPFFKKGNFNFLPLINPFGGYFYSIFYFVSGAILSSKIDKKAFQISPYISFIFYIFMAFLLFLYGILMSFSNNSMYDVVFSCYDTVMTLIMSFSLFVLFSKLNYSNEHINNILAFIGKNTFGIYIIHVVFVKFLKPSFSASDYSNNIIANLVFALIILILSLLTTALFKKIQPTSFFFKI